MQGTLGLLYLLLGMVAFSLAFLSLMIVAPVALFAAKAGVLPVPADLKKEPWDPRKAITWAAKCAAIITLICAFGTVLVYRELIHRSGEIAYAHVAMYGTRSCPVPHSGRGSDDLCPFAWMWNVIKADALPFFIATMLLLYRRARSANRRAKGEKTAWVFVGPAVTGAGAFLLAMYLGRWFSIAENDGFLKLFTDMAAVVTRETLSPFRFIGALIDGEAAVKAWLHDEVVRMGASFYKMASLYPKVLFVMLAASAASYAAS